MIYIFTENYENAAGFISYFKLKKNMNEPYFQIFRNDKAEVKLIITGKDALHGALAAGYLLSGYIYQPEDLFLCVQKGRLGLFHELISEQDGKYFYPDMCPKHEFEERTTKDIMLCALYQSLIPFTRQHQLIFAAADSMEDAEKIGAFLLKLPKLLKEKHPFSHIYIEERVKNTKEAEALKEKFHIEEKQIVLLHHYKDFFDRKHQDIGFQKNSPALILAHKEGRLIYDGAEECQNFNNEYFYYTSSMMNCLFDCEYCYLQGMYPSANVVWFINLEEIFKEVDKLLAIHPVYLCISYDTDLLALENLTGYCRKWMDYARGKDQLTIELRTKACIPMNMIEEYQKNPCENFIFAFTLSTEMVQLKYEHYTPSTKARIESVKAALSSGMKIRLSFDPLIYMEGWEDAYGQLMDQVFAEIHPEKLYDISLGQFRVPCDYIKKMRRKRPDSELLQYPFVTDGKISSYGAKGQQMTEYLKNHLKKYVKEEKIFEWKE